MDFCGVKFGVRGCGVGKLCVYCESDNLCHDF